MAVAQIVAGKQDKVTLGRIDTYRDWGWAPDYVKVMPLITALDEPDDFVLATGESHSVSEWCEAAFAVAELDWKQYVYSDPQRYRPDEVEFLQGDASKAKRILGWEPTLTFKEIAIAMVQHDLAALP
jgi:GDPmannose 4,6-dehydratase